MNLHPRGGNTVERTPVQELPSFRRDHYDQRLVRDGASGRWRLWNGGEQISMVANGSGGGDGESD